MTTDASRGLILIADTTSYTACLDESELEHAQGTLTDLLGLLVEHTRSPLVATQLEGDAVVSYALQAGLVRVRPSWRATTCPLVTVPESSIPIPMEHVESAAVASLQPNR